jgi:hypothetical protein
MTASHLGNQDTWRTYVPAASRYRPHKATIYEMAEEEISFRRLRERCDVVANRLRSRPIPRRFRPPRRQEFVDESADFW